MHRLFKTLDDVGNINVIIAVRVDDKMYYLTGGYYIESYDWTWEITEDKTKAITSQQFIHIVEKEAEDICWDNNIRVSRLDACLYGHCYFKQGRIDDSWIDDKVDGNKFMSLEGIDNFGSDEVVLTAKYI